MDFEYSENRYDQELGVAVKEILRNSRYLDSKDISVEVDDGRVTLSGTVPSELDRKYALQVVELINGVNEVRSELIVKLNPGILPTDIGRQD